jgi:chromosome partitioning protein
LPKRIEKGKYICYNIRCIKINTIGKGIAMGKIISFANQKGGVGKTTSAVNVAASLGLLGSRVLLIDLDPQGNATSGVGIMKRDLKGTTREFLTEEGDKKSTIHETEFSNLWVIPANTSLAGAEFDLFDFEESEYRLKKLLAPLKDEFDYIIIDCPPSLGMLTVNALSASDGIVVPMQCEFYSLEGLSQLMMTIKRIKRLYNPELSVTGILVTMYNGRLLLSMQVLSELKKHYADKLFSTEISRNVKLSEAPGFGRPVYYHDKRSKGSVEYMEVAKELRARI